MLRRRMMLAQGGVSLPAGYMKIEYLESDGNSYIDTGFKPNNNTRVVMDASLLSLDGDQYFYGAKDTGSTQSFVCAYSEGSITFGYGSSFPSASYNASVLQKISIDQNCNDGYINRLKVVTANDAIFQTPYSLYLCARNNGGAVTKLTKLMIYSCQIYDNGTLVRDFIPAMNASGEAGLYDLKNDVWYALLPVAKPKVENKITFEVYYDKYENPYTGLTDIYAVITIYSTYAITSDLDITFQNSIGASKTFRMLKGSSEYNPAAVKGFGIPTLTSISPTEDDTYIYTF